MKNSEEGNKQKMVPEQNKLNQPHMVIKEEEQ